jgi:hypothetical protein
MGNSNSNKRFIDLSIPLEDEGFSVPEGLSDSNQAQSASDRQKNNPVP